ncbi:MAG: sodium/proton-translocating pyrophosphatase, partial [Nitrososphaerota archaeon]|nr:sodium/proton-translocating pyrophosphatase [Nitrososphaerota archaeon]
MFIPLEILSLSNTQLTQFAFLLAPIAGIIAIVTSLLLMRKINKMDPGSPKAQEVAQAIRIGAYAFLKRQYTTISIITAVIFVLIAVALDVGTAAAFLIGAV